MKYVLIFIVSLFFMGCEVLKRSSLKKTDTDLTERIVTKTQRVGDTVTFTVPKVVLRDTTIYTVNRVGSRIETRFNSEGKIDKIECLTSTVDLLIEENKRLLEFVKSKDTEKEKQIDDSGLLTAIIGVGVVLGLVMMGGIWYIKR